MKSPRQNQRVEADDAGAKKKPNKVASPITLDLDAIEQTMTARFRAILRHTGLVALFGVLLATGLIVLAIYLTAAPTVLRIAVGPKDSVDVRLVQALANKFNRERSAFRLEPIILNEPVGIRDIMGRPNYDLAVVASSPNMSPDWPAVAILRNNLLVLMVPAPPGTPAQAPAKDAKSKAATAKAGAKKAPGIASVPDLAGRRVGLIARSEATPELLKVLLDHYKVPAEKVVTVPVEPDKLKSALSEGLFDAILVTGPANSRALSVAAEAAANTTAGPTFIAINHAEAIANRIPAYTSASVKAGAFLGSPASPAEDFTTLGFYQLLVASKTLSEATVAGFAKQFYASRQALAYELPGLVKIESPSTDKDSAILLHPGADAYLNDNQKSFFDKYGDQIFYALLIFPFIGSALAAVAGYFRADKGARRQRRVNRMMQVVKKARGAESLAVLDQLVGEIDGMLNATIREADDEQLDELGLMSFSLALDQARLAVAERRAALAPLLIAPPLPIGDSTKQSQPVGA